MLPDSFGTDVYDKREDVIAIRVCVYKALDHLDKEIHFSEQLKNNRHVIIKPNLVSAYHNCGFRLIILRPRILVFSRQ